VQKNRQGIEKTLGESHLRNSILIRSPRSLAARIRQSQMDLPAAGADPERIPAARDIPIRARLSSSRCDGHAPRAISAQSRSGWAMRPLTLLYPEWLPGNHAPRGPIASIAGLRISGGGKPIAWRRDPAYVYAFHVDVPAGVRELTVDFQHLSPTASPQGRIVMTPDLLNLQWEKMTLYPAGYFTRNIPVSASVTYPAGWTAATSLDVASKRGDRIAYKPVSYETLVDSPVFAGRYYRKEKLSSNVNLNLFADRPEDSPQRLPSSWRRTAAWSSRR
jgi:predicted metalloprotease with PDZ domain